MELGPEQKSELYQKISELSILIRTIEDYSILFKINPANDKIYIALVAYRQALNDLLK